MTTNFKKNEFSFLKTVLSPLLGQLHMYSALAGNGAGRKTDMYCIMYMSLIAITEGGCVDITYFTVQYVHYSVNVCLHFSVNLIMDCSTVCRHSVFVLQYYSTVQFSIRTLFLKISKILRVKQVGGQIRIYMYSTSICTTHYASLIM